MQYHRSVSARVARVSRCHRRRTHTLITTAPPGSSTTPDINRLLNQLPTHTAADLPSNIDDYVHRIGRTGRAGHTGSAITFLNEDNKNLARELAELLAGACMRAAAVMGVIAGCSPSPLCISPLRCLSIPRAHLTDALYTRLHFILGFVMLCREQPGGAGLAGHHGRIRRRQLLRRAPRRPWSWPRWRRLRWSRLP